MTQLDFTNALSFIQSILNNDLVPALDTLQLSGTVATDTMNDIISYEESIILNLNNLITALPTLKGDKGDQGIQGIPGESGSSISRILQEIVITSPTSTVDFLNLDLIAHKSYTIEAEIAVGSSGSFLLYANGDFTDANYKCEYLCFDGATNYNNRYSYPYFAVNVSDTCAVTAKIQMSYLSASTNRLSFSSTFDGETFSTIRAFFTKTKYSVPVSNLTSISIKGAMGSSFNVGTKFRLIRGDV